jgi:hypothetical protein
VGRAKHGKNWVHLNLRFPGVDDMITIFAKKMAFFSKTNVMMKILHNVALSRVKNTIFFAEIFGENI